jgi:glycosyltransferase involved in cell wall biosynthesis
LIVRASRRLTGPVLYHDQFASLTGLIRKRETGEPYAMYLHETALDRTEGAFKDSFVKALDQKVLTEAEIVFTNSRTNKATLQSHDIPSKVAYPGCYPVQHLSTQRDHFVIATSVWDQGRKPECYLELARKTKAKVVLIGTWARQEHLTDFMHKAGDLVTTTGPVSEATLRDLSERAFAYVRFGFGERGPGQGGIQAMAHGLPVLTNRGLGMAEIVSDDEDGYVVDSIDEAGTKLDSLWEHSNSRERIMRNAWEKSKLMTWSSHTDVIRGGLASVGLCRRRLD